jgi:putative chitinase
LENGARLPSSVLSLTIAGAFVTLTKSVLAALWPQGDSDVPGLTDGIVLASDRIFAQSGLATTVAVAHAMAQFSHECGGGTTLVETLNYSAPGLMATWPSRFDAARSAAFAHQPERIANEVYNGRLGNRVGSDDGWTYRGRGGAQVTGRGNYARLSGAVGLDLLAEPDLLNHPDHFLACAVGQFLLCGCLPFALHDDVSGVTLHLNGGYIGLAQRQAWLARWKTALACQDQAMPSTVWVQQRLNNLGEHPPLVVDGAFGPMTGSALKSFQAAHALTVDGRLDPATVAALIAAA